ncbi:hypothetical protein [Leptothrix ochracea]|uniref:hypothetical protein n=1 Tax=Leptothrix ochracea TaxID=735331 RepID=UPI0034E2D2B6
MKTLFLAWQAAQQHPNSGQPSRAWYPIGRLEAAQDRRIYRFTYTQGARRAQKESGFAPLMAFPNIDCVYEDDELFPLFQNRLLNPRRSDYPAFLERMAMTPEDADPMEVLALSEGMRQTDHLQVFPPIQTDGKGHFHSRFFLHGWRHANPMAQERLQRLRQGEALRVALEINNPVASMAVQLQSSDDLMVMGWAPRYLVDDLVRACHAAPTEITAHVCKINRPPVPYQQRVLVELSGQFRDTYEPMSGPDFQPIEDTLPHGNTLA